MTDMLIAAKHIFVVPHQDKATELRKKIDLFTGNFDRDLIEIRAEQGLVFMYDIHCNLTDSWFVSTTMAKNAETATDKKELDDLVSALGGNRLPLRDPCMEGTLNDILTKIEREVKSVDGLNVIWIRGFPGVGKSALAASIVIQLREQHRHVIWFLFDRTRSTTITTDALWRTVACSLASLSSKTLSPRQQGAHFIRCRSAFQIAHRDTIIHTD